MPGQIFVMDQQVVCPGDLLAEGDFEIPWSPYIYKESNRYYASVVGVVDVKNGTFTVIPLKGSKYWPRVGDTVL
ncbi:MAG: RNA-binding protein, partial [Sulfolobales archaeon]|nr:RNA-binding protein [Sulfolobales archaeon]